MTGSLKAKPLHAVPAALLSLMGDQWAVDSVNSRGAQQIHRKARETNTNLTRRHMKACRVRGSTMSSSEKIKLPDTGTRASQTGVQKLQLRFHFVFSVYRIKSTYSIQIPQNHL